MQLASVYDWQIQYTLCSLAADWQTRPHGKDPKDGCHFMPLARIFRGAHTHSDPLHTHTHTHAREWRRHKMAARPFPADGAIA